MEAKDTVITQERVWDLKEAERKRIGSCAGFGTRDMRMNWDDEVILKAQAETTYPIAYDDGFKAGRESAFKEMLLLPQDMKVYESENIVDEKSYKAGYKQSRDEMDIQLTSLADLCLEHRKGGIKEVVEFLKKQGAVWVDKNYAIINAIEKMGKLKEWGIYQNEE